MGKIKKKISEEEIVNWWLKKYHNTNIDQVKKEHPEWDDGENHSREFYSNYQVTQEQHDEWYEWVLKALQKSFGGSKKYVGKNSWAVYLNSSPLILKMKDKNEIT